MDFDTILRFLIALVFVLGLIGLLSWAARRFGLAGRVPVRKGRVRRTMVVEATALDAKRRLVLVRRDDTEHLILLGPVGDLVVEQGILPGETDGAGTTGNGPPVRDFSSELEARTMAQDTPTSLSSTEEPASPDAVPAQSRNSGSARPAASRRTLKSKLAPLKPARARLPNSTVPKA